MERVGWSADITSRNKRHFYMNGKSLCNKAEDTFRLRHFEISKGYIPACDCAICVDKSNELIDKGELIIGR